MLALILTHWRTVVATVLVGVFWTTAVVYRVERDHARAELATLRNAREAERAAQAVEVARARAEAAAAVDAAQKASQEAEKHHAELETEYGRLSHDLGARLGLCLSAARTGPGSVSAGPAPAGGPPETAGEPAGGGEIAAAAQSVADACAADAARLGALQDWVRGALP